MSRTTLWSDEATGLRAVLVIDDDTLGPAAGGIRTRPYLSADDAVADARRLARAMTLKCAVAGLNAGGGKIVVWGLGDDRQGAFEELGRRLQAHEEGLLTAGDLGTTNDDLAAMARTTGQVHTGGDRLAQAAGLAVLRCVQACADALGQSVDSLHVAIAGCGTIGGAAARALASAGVRLTVADLVRQRAESLADGLNAAVCGADELLSRDVDVVSPCAEGGAITEEIAGSLQARAVCGAANNVLASPEAERTLMRRGILYVPDALASAGAVIEGVGERVMNLDDRRPLIDRLRDTTRTVLDEVRTTGLCATEIVERLARTRIAAASLALLLAAPLGGVPGTALAGGGGSGSTVFGGIQARASANGADEEDERRWRGLLEPRRVRLGVKGVVADAAASYKVEVGFDRGSPSLKDAYFDLPVIDGDLRASLRFGQFKRPWSRHLRISDWRLSLSERGITEKAFLAERDRGGELIVRWQGMSLELGGFAGTGISPPDAGRPQGGGAIAARVAWTKGDLRTNQFPDLKGGDMRLSVGVGGHSHVGDLPTGREGQKGTVDFIVKSAGLTLSGAGYAWTRNKTLGALAQVGYVVDGKYLPAVRYAFVSPDGAHNDTQEVAAGLTVFFAGDRVAWLTEGSMHGQQSERRLRSDWRGVTQINVLF